MKQILLLFLSQFASGSWFWLEHNSTRKHNRFMWFQQKIWLSDFFRDTVVNNAAGFNRKSCKSTFTETVFMSVRLRLSCGLWIWIREGPDPPHTSKSDSVLTLCFLLLCVSGSAIRCYSCKDYTASCSKQRDCSYDDACLTLNERGTCTPLHLSISPTHFYTCTAAHLFLYSNHWVHWFLIGQKPKDPTGPKETRLDSLCVSSRWNDLPSVPQVFRLWAQPTGPDVPPGNNHCSLLGSTVFQCHSTKGSCVDVVLQNRYQI